MHHCIGLHRHHKDPTRPPLRQDLPWSIRGFWLVFRVHGTFPFGFRWIYCTPTVCVFLLCMLVASARQLHPDTTEFIRTHLSQYYVYPFLLEGVRCMHTTVSQGSMLAGVLVLS